MKPLNATNLALFFLLRHCTKKHCQLQIFIKNIRGIMEYHIALDVDDTLLAGPESTLRPHLQVFLQFCHENFATVSLLTLSRESECKRKLGELYKYITQHIYAFPRKENGFCSDKDLRWVYHDISKVIMVEDPLAEMLNVNWEEQRQSYIVVAPFDYNAPQNDNELLRVMEVIKKRLNLN